MTKSYSIIVKSSYSKPWLCIDDQLAKLEARGLVVTDREKSLKFLSYINYYRFAGYALKFENWDDGVGDRVFKDGVTFDDVRFICEFDRDLRDVFFEGLELVEISLRSIIAHKFAEKYGPFGHLHKNNFSPMFVKPSVRSSKTSYQDWHEKILRETERSKEMFVRHFENHYTQFPDLPIWVVAEICSFGSLSEMLSNLLRRDQATIASVYRLQYDEVASWAHALTYVRNICAHHARLWDKEFRITPKLPINNVNWMKMKGREKTVYVAALMINWMLAHDSIDNCAHRAWKVKLEEQMDRLQKTFPKLFLSTGFEMNWKKNPLWWQY